MKSDFEHQLNNTPFTGTLADAIYQTVCFTLFVIALHTMHQLVCTKAVKILWSLPDGGKKRKKNFPLYLYFFVLNSVL